LSSGLHLSRREFLAAANAGALLLLLESCSLGPLGRGSSSPQSSASLIRQALTNLRAALRASPDHLAFRAESVVASKDSAKIVDFVRDSLAVVPPWGAADDYTAIRWGRGAALRGGQGTLRERADILADLLTRAGFKATVMAADRPSSIGIAQMYRQRTPAFSPAAGKVDSARSLLRQAGLPAAQAQRPFTAGPDPAAAILAALPADLQQARVRTDLLPQVVPVVQFAEGGKTRYAFALDDLGVSDSAPPGLRSGGGTSDAPAVSITVSALSEPAVGSTTAGGRLIDLVSATWRLDKVAGRQVLLTFSPTAGPQAVIDNGLDGLTVRVPFLRVQTDTPGATDPSLIAAGKLVTLQGDVLGPAVAAAPAPGTPVDGPYGPLLSLSDSDRAAAEGRVATIKVSANPAAFPEIELLMDVADATGASVDGLDARSFTVQDGGAQVAAISVYSNARRQQRPRVLVIYDSYVEWWPSAAVKSKFDSALASALVAQAAKSPFDVQAVGLGATPIAGSWGPPDAAALTTAFGSQFESADDPWGSTGGAALDQGVNAIICISDFNNGDGDPNKIPSYQHRIAAAHVPVFAVPSGQAFGQFNGALGTEIAAFSGGATFDATDAATPGKLAAAVGNAIGSWVGPAYRLRYLAATGAPPQRTVNVGITGRQQARGTATYELPAKPIPPPSFAGLYVKIDVGGLESVRRIAGVEITDRGGPLGVTGDAGAIAETRAAMNGVTTIAFEPGSPTSSAILDDVVSSLLSVEPIAELPVTATSDQLLKAAQHGIRRVPIALASLLRPTKVDPNAVAGLKVAILQDRPVSSAVIEQHADLAIGTNPVIPLVADPAAAFKAAVATSVAACAAEAATFPVSAYANLSGAALTLIKANDFGARDAWLASLPADQQAAWKSPIIVYDDYHRLVPVGGKAGAFWVVEPGSGVVKAVLLDSTGGGLIRAGCDYDAFDQLAMSIAFLSVLCSFGGAALFPFWCIGINVLAVGMTVAAYFKINGKRHDDVGTGFSLGLGVAGLAGIDFLGLEAPIGIMLMLITIQNACRGTG
jgi:hypothetical protein